MKTRIIGLLLVAFFISSCKSAMFSFQEPPEGKCEICKTVKGERETFCWIVYNSVADKLVGENKDENSFFYWIPKNK